jgi:hypothetical protein
MRRQRCETRFGLFYCGNHRANAAAIVKREIDAKENHDREDDDVL